MAENSKIEWTDHTFNPWVGCTKVSPACDHCYAEGWAKRTGSPGLWQGDRRRTTPANWAKPRKWDEIARRRSTTRARVFCASLADIFDNQIPAEWRGDLWHLIFETPWLAWQLLTKRPQNIEKMLPTSPRWNGWPNVWLGTTTEDQTRWDRNIEALGRIPAVVRFVSVEPMLGPIDVGNAFDTAIPDGSPYRPINWVICGGESGPSARHMDPDWARDLRDQCAAWGVPFFMKQMARKAPIPADLMVREFPSPKCDEKS